MLELTPYDPAKPIDQPGVYTMTQEHYHADPCATPSLSASVCKLGLPGGRKGGSPLHMQWGHPRLRPVPAEEQGRAIFDLGSVFHAIMLGSGQEIVVVDAADWRTNAAKAARDAAYKADQQPILKSQMDQAMAMRRAVLPQVQARPDLHTSMQSGTAEVVLVWVEETPAGPIFCRCMVDWVPDHGNVFPDWKTTGGSAAPDDYGRVMFDIGADVQDAFYRRGIEAVLGRRAHLVFPVVETAEPHAMMVHAIDPTSLALAQRKVQWAINTFGMCLGAEIWPGYPLDTAHQSAPPWVENAWTDREDAGLTARETVEQMIEEIRQMPLLDHAVIDPETAADFGLDAPRAHDSRNQDIASTEGA